MSVRNSQTHNFYFIKAYQVRVTRDFIGYKFFKRQKYYMMFLKNIKTSKA